MAKDVLMIALLAVATAMGGVMMARHPYLGAFQIAACGTALAVRIVRLRHTPTWGCFMTDGKSGTRYQDRDTRNGRFDFDGNMNRLCKCGHRLGDHFAVAPRECMNSPEGSSNPTCDCLKFRLPRRRKVDEQSTEVPKWAKKLSLSAYTYSHKTPGSSMARHATTF
jgi:hypothetical protein